MRRAILLFAALLLAAALSPGAAQAFKPEIVNVRATDDNEGLRFTVKVRMDKGGRDQRDVNVTYEGDTQNARYVQDPGPPLSLWEAGAYAGPRRDCYRVRIRAKNRDGVTERTMRAPRIGGDGC
jgi:hypothetical protein